MAADPGSKDGVLKARSLTHLPRIATKDAKDLMTTAHLASSYGENLRQQGPALQAILDANRGDPKSEIVLSRWPVSDLGLDDNCRGTVILELSPGTQPDDLVVRRDQGIPHLEGHGPRDIEPTCGYRRKTSHNNLQYCGVACYFSFEVERLQRRFRREKLENQVNRILLRVSLLLLLSSCVLDVDPTTQQVPQQIGTCVSDPIAPGGGDGDVVPQCPPPPGIRDATANALAVAANHINVAAPSPPPSVSCNDDLQRCTTFFWLSDTTYLRTICGYALPISCSSDEFAYINGWYVIILSF